MRTLILATVMTSVLFGCKSKQELTSKKASQPASAFGDDEGAIEVPKELESQAALTENTALISRSRLKRSENYSKELVAGSRLSVKVRGASEVTLAFSMTAPVKAVMLKVNGAESSELKMDAETKSFQVGLKNKAEQMLTFAVPEGSQPLHLNSLDAAGGEILEWKIIAP